MQSASLLRAALMGLFLAAPLPCQEALLIDSHGQRSAPGRTGGGRPVGEPGPAAADLVAPDWSPIGPFGGDVADVAVSPVDPAIVLAGVAPASVLGSLFRSVDAGTTWSEVAALDDTNVYDIEFAPNGDAFAGTFYGVWKSSDGGASWQKLPAPLGINENVFEVTLSPSQPGRIWIGGDDNGGAQSDLVFRSDDGGATWVDVSPPTSSQDCLSIAVDPEDADRVFVGFRGFAGGGALWFSTNGGASWSDVSAGLPPTGVVDLHHDGERVLACGGQLFGGQDFGLFESTDEGASWVALHDATWPSLAANDIEIDPADGDRWFLGTVGAGVFRSEDGGATWDFGIGGTGELSVNEITFFSAGTAPIWIGCDALAVWRSADGATFAPSSEGIAALRVSSVAAHPSVPEELAVSFESLNSGGVYRSTDSGASWDLEAVPPMRFSTVEFAPDGALYALSNGPTTIAGEGVYRRAPDATWTALGPDQSEFLDQELFSLGFGHANPDLLVAGGSDFAFAGTEAGLWRTSDGGASWTRAFEGTVGGEEVRDVIALPDGTDQTWLAAFDTTALANPGGVLRSGDGGASWQLSSSGLDPDADCTQLAVSSAAPGTVYLADNGKGPGISEGGLYRSSNGGLSWSNTGPLSEILGVVHDPLVPDVLYMAERAGGLFEVPYSHVTVTENAGASFAAFDAGLTESGSFRDLELAAGSCTRLLLATHEGIWSTLASCALEADVTQVSLSTGGQQNLSLQAGPEHAGRSYGIAGSASGTSPPTPLGSILLPLVLDPYLLYTLSHPATAPLSGFQGVLDAEGAGSASLTFPPGFDSSLVGLTLHHAFVVFVFAPGFEPLFASNAEPLQLLP
ncbi:MAG: hypothetical protein AAF682_28490 [Planctomycetota bacterium]